MSEGIIVSLIVSITTLLVTIITPILLYILTQRQNKKIDETKSSVQELSKEVNGKLKMLVVAEKGLSKAEGKVEGIAEQKEEQKKDFLVDYDKDKIDPT